MADSRRDVSGEFFARVVPIADEGQIRGHQDQRPLFPALIARSIGLAPGWCQVVGLRTKSVKVSRELRAVLSCWGQRIPCQARRSGSWKGSGTQSAGRTLPSQGPLSHARSRQVWKVPRMTGPDSAVVPVSGTSRLRAAVNPRPPLTDSLHNDSMQMVRSLTGAGRQISRW